jgi:glycosyltransferase involved in cell wall biosynthesis
MFYVRLAANLLSSLPYFVTTHMSSELGCAIGDVAARGDVDLWQAEWTPYAQSLPKVKGAARLIMAHNVESEIWRRYWETELHPAKRWYIRLQWQKIEAFERRVFAEVDGVVAVSQPDAELIRRRFAVRRVDVVENGVDTAYFPFVAEASARNPHQLLFLGSLDWRPNLDAAQLLLSRIFPAVQTRQPLARLWLVGRNPPDSLRRLIGKSDGAELHADVSDVRPFLARSALLVVPLRVGGGSRLKILEALAAGLPVVSTRVGAEGLEVEDGRHLTLVDDTDCMATGIIAGLADQQQLVTMAERGRYLVEQQYDWRLLAERLEECWTAIARPGLEAQKPLADDLIRRVRA